ncbi:hypothetical protein V8G54_005852 [Vigna mungo]|uniref:Uncharacterized protein n=1 Tax=Vigna mungo TaxID=3915 RepID=A0AAQ3NYZ9_VIGMU
MSMFSHFDIAQGQNWSFSLGLGPVKGADSKPNSDGTSSSAESKTARKDPNQSSTGGSKQNPARLKPRFAPEFDGVKDNKRVFWSVITYAELEEKNVKQCSSRFPIADHRHFGCGGLYSTLLQDTKNRPRHQSGYIFFCPSLESTKEGKTCFCKKTENNGTGRTKGTVEGGIMAMGSIFAAVPAIAAAAGFYFIGRNNVKEIKQGSSVSSQKMLAEVKEPAKSLQRPKLAPQFDGLDCFETLVMN